LSALRTAAENQIASPIECQGSEARESPTKADSTAEEGPDAKPFCRQQLLEAAAQLVRKDGGIVRLKP
jgi:hypothetical protein